MRLIEWIKAITITMIVSLTQTCIVYGFDTSDCQADCRLIGDLDADGIVTMNEIKQLNIDLVQGKVSYDIAYKAIENFEAIKKGAGTAYCVQSQDIENYMQEDLNHGGFGCQSNIENPLVDVGLSLTVPPIINVGGRDFAKSDPLPIASSKLSTFVIDYTPIGRHVMLMPVYDEMKASWRYRVMHSQDENAYFFGKDFSLGTIDNNYADAPFITQFLADP